MNAHTDITRRTLLKNIAVSVVFIPLAGLSGRAALAADGPLVTADDPTARSMQYVDDASKAGGAKAGSKCATCMLYQGAAGSAQGGCSVFPGKSVKATGWCVAWTPKG